MVQAPVLRPPKMTKGVKGKDGAALSPSLKAFTEKLAAYEGVNELVVLRENGEIVCYRSGRPLLKNSVPFLALKARQAGGLFNFSGFRYAAMQRGKGKKMIVLAGETIMAGVEADARCLQKSLLDSISPLFLQADRGE